MLLAAGPAMAQQKSVKIGFVSTFSGPTAVIGNDMRNSFELALDHIDRKMGGLPVEVIYKDDQQKPDVGRQNTCLLYTSHADIFSYELNFLLPKAFQFQGRTLSDPISPPLKNSFGR